MLIIFWSYGGYKWSVGFQQNLSLSSNCARNYGGQLSMTFLPCLLGHLEAPAQINQSHSCFGMLQPRLLPLWRLLLLWANVQDEPEFLTHETFKTSSHRASLPTESPEFRSSPLPASGPPSARPSSSELQLDSRFYPTWKYCSSNNLIVDMTTEVAGEPAEGISKCSFCDRWVWDWEESPTLSLSLEQQHNFIEHIDVYSGVQIAKHLRLCFDLFESFEDWMICLNLL